MPPLDESESVRSEPRRGRRRRPMGRPDPIMLALGGDRPQGRPDAGRPPMFEPPPLGPHDHGSHMPEEDEFADEDPREQAGVLDLLEMLQGGEEEEMRPIDEEGEPWGMDTDPGDAQVLRNLLATRRQGLRQGRYPLG